MNTNETVANIGIRLGYSQVITARANTSIDFIVLDEPFGALDEENRDLVKKVFAIISQWFTQILVISHDDSIENFPNVLRIGKTAEGCSYILN
jgi:DNA repair exonuclease SbcCD ATPase subunit